MVERDLVRMRQQITRLQKELHEKEQELKNKHRSEDRKNLQSEEEKGAYYKYMFRAHLEFGEEACRSGLWHNKGKQ